MMVCQDEIIDHHYRSAFEELKTEERSYWPSVGVCRWSSSTAADTAASTQTWCLSPNDFNLIYIKHINMQHAVSTRIEGDASKVRLNSRLLPLLHKDMDSSGGKTTTRMTYSYTDAAHTNMKTIHDRNEMYAEVCYQYVKVFSKLNPVTCLLILLLYICNWIFCLSYSHTYTVILQDSVSVNTQT